jgi:hypothetical protein
MLGCSVQGYIKSCGNTTGGVAQLFLGDANDFDFTSAADDANGNPTGYSAVTRHTGATASNTIGSVTVTAGGTGYTSVPTVVFTGGGGSGAAGTAVLTAQVVTSVTITNAGTGYTSNPTVSFTGGGGSGATATAARSTGGAYFFPVDFVQETLHIDWDQTYSDGSSNYAFTIAGRLSQISQQLTNFNSKLDSSAACCQLIIVWVMNDGKIFVLGEKNVDAAELQKFQLRQDGSKGTTGTRNIDFNGEDLSIKGNYFRKFSKYLLYAYQD